MQFGQGGFAADADGRLETKVRGCGLRGSSRHRISKNPGKQRSRRGDGVQGNQVAAGLFLAFRRGGIIR